MPSERGQKAAPKVRWTDAPVASATHIRHLMEMKPAAKETASMTPDSLSITGQVRVFGIVAAGITGRTERKPRARIF